MLKSVADDPEAQFDVVATLAGIQVSVTHYLLGYTDAIKAAITLDEQRTACDMYIEIANEILGEKEVSELIFLFNASHSLRGFLCSRLPFEGVRQAVRLESRVMQGLGRHANTTALRAFDVVDLEILPIAATRP